MRIDELKKIAEENDYEYSKGKWNHKFTREANGNYVTINGDYRNRIWTSIQGYCDDKDFNTIKASIEYAETPPEDREEEKKFYLRHRWLENWRDSNYLNFELSGNYYGLNDKREVFWAKTKFTFKEIEEIKEKLDTDLNDFELVEVEDVD